MRGNNLNRSEMKSSSCIHTREWVMSPQVSRKRAVEVRYTPFQPQNVKG
jgi:hypothetical protein